ncbi:hypothetical protein M9Y10_012279 [Tritrichomonas musculus]|uniref:non-specific serine/threonine protein kinase n=1 Tax=Tritrichomonas musculus TaxID=1915356 RepID=A0ABR2ID90_9EUKA
MNKTIICSRFALHHKLGAGSFGEIYSAEDLMTHKMVAVKLESNKIRSPQLEYEARIYQIMSEGAGIPKLYFFGAESKHNVMAIDLLGKSLEDHLSANRHPLSLKTVLMLADQMIECVQYMHYRHFIHRDIKPDNFVMGLKGSGNENKVFMIDFGLAKRYRDPKSFSHIPYVENKSLTGTARYASVNAMQGCEQSRRDDMESLGFVFIYLLKGKLPWQGLPARDQKQKMKKILDVKRNTEIDDLCEDLPSEFSDYLHSVRKLEFEEEPDYKAYKKMFRDLFIKEGFVYDSIYDWTFSNLPAKKAKKKSKKKFTTSAPLKTSNTAAAIPPVNPVIPEQNIVNKYRVHPPEEPPTSSGRAIRQYVARRYGTTATATAATGIRRSAEREKEKDRADILPSPNIPPSQTLQPQQQQSSSAVISSTRGANEKRLKTAMPVPRLPNLPSLTPRINRPQIAPRHYQSRRAVQVGE